MTTERPDRPVISRAKAHRVIELANKLGLEQYQLGSCGPAAVAINAVLFKGRASYVVLTSKKAKRNGERRGHVGLRYRGKYYDYTGAVPFTRFDEYAEAYDEFELLTGVREATVRRHFCLKHCEPVDLAHNILKLALGAENDGTQKETVAKYKRAMKKAGAILETASLEDVLQLGRRKRKRTSKPRKKTTRKKAKKGARARA